MQNPKSNPLQAGSFLTSHKTFLTTKPIKIIELYGNFRISIRFFYTDNTIDSYGDLFRFQGSINLEQDEIIQINYCSKTYLDFLCIKTAKGKIIKAGEPDVDIERFNFSHKTQKIIGFYGSFNHFICGFGLKTIEKEIISMQIEESKENQEEEGREMKKAQEEDMKIENKQNEMVSEEKEADDKSNEVQHNMEIEENIEETSMEPKNTPKENYSKLSQIIESLNIKVFLILSSEYCQITAKLMNYFREASNNRVIFLPNEKYPSASYFFEALEYYATQFKMKANVLKPNEISIIAIKIPIGFKDKNLISLSKSILYFSITQESFLKNFEMARDKFKAKLSWKEFLESARRFLEFSQKQLNSFINFHVFSTEKLISLTNEGLTAIFQGFLKELTPDSVSFPVIDLIQELENLKNLKVSNKEELNFRELNQDNSYSKWATRFLFKFFQEMKDTMKFSLVLSEKLKKRTHYIAKLFAEFNLLKEQKYAMTSVILRHKFDNNKTFAINICNFLESYIKELDQYSEKPLEKEKTKRNLEEKEAETQKIIDETSYLTDEFFENSDFLNCHRLIEVLIQVLSNEQLNTELIESLEFISLCSNLLSHKSVFFNIQGIKLFFKALNNNPQNYSLKLSHFEQNITKNPKISRILLDVIYKICGPFYILPFNSILIQKYLILLENYRVFQISGLYEGSFYHCSDVTCSDIEFLFEMIEFFFVKVQEFENTTQLLGLLSVFLSFSEANVISEILTYRKELLSIANQCLNFYINNKQFEQNFKIVVELINTILFAISKKEFYIERTQIRKEACEIEFEDFKFEENDKPNQKKKKEKNKEKKKNIEKKPKKKKKEIQKDLEKEKKRLKELKIEEKDLKKGLEMAISLKKPGDDFLVYEKADKEKLKLIIEEQKIENFELNAEKLAMKSVLEKEKQNFDILLNSNRGLELEKFELKQKISLLMQENEEKARAIAKIQALSMEKPINDQENAQSFDEDHDEFLFVTSPEFISESQARFFIENLQKTRKNMKDLRSSICGALKFLGNDLYSSQTHFFYEIIQNAEDNQYLIESQNPPFLYFSLTEEFILISNNERGFIPKNVAAICQIGQSSKSGGFSIGQKGLGFKSVFSCSNYPQIYSNPWKFAFKIEDGSDELQYITPQWIEQIPESLNIYLAKYQSQTSIFLPFKESLSKERRKQLNDEIIANLDENILLNLSNLKEIRVINEKTQESTVILKEIISESYLGDIKFNSSSFRNLTRRELLVKKARNSNENILESTNFLCYTCELEIPIAIINEEKSFKSNSLTRILLAFPLINKSNIKAKPYPIYAFLPLIKENHGFKFIINCDWVLTTNRESIRENEWNAFVRNNLAQFLVNLMFRDEYVKLNFAEFLPREVKNLWWRRFSHDISEELNKKENMLKMFNFGSEKEVFLSNENIRNLMNFDRIQEILKNVFILDRNTVNAEIFEKSCKVLSIEQVIDCLENEEFHLEKSENNKKNKKWWKDFFKILLEELPGKKSSLIREKVKNSGVFLCNKNKRSKINGQFENLHVFICKDEKLREFNWRKEILLLDYDSEYEYKVLSKLLMFPDITVEKLLKLIYSLHVNYEESEEIEEEVIWKDLEFIKSHYQEFNQYFSNQALGLLVPTFSLGNKEKVSISRVVHSVFPYIFAVGINEEDLGKDQIIKKTIENLEEILPWELFFLQIGSKVPIIQRIQNEKPYYFHDFKQIPQSFIETALKIIEIQGSLVYQVRNMHILCKDDLSYPIKEVFDINLINEEFPCIDIPHNCKKLAEKLGVTVKSSFKLSMKILENLAKKQENSIEKFQKWLYHLNSSLTDKNIEEFLENNEISVPFLYFPQEFKPYVAIEDLFLSEEKNDEQLEFLSLICQKNKKVLISIKNNLEYMSFHFLFKKLGARYNLDFEFLNNFVEELIREEDIYYEKGNKMSLLSEKGLKLLNKAFEIYESILEKAIPMKKSGENINWQFRANISLEIMKYLKKSPFKNLALPFITHRKTLIPPLSSISKLKFACLNPEIINEITSESQDYVFFEPDFALAYPRVLALMGIEYLELNSRITFGLNRKNPLRILSNLSKNINLNFLDQNDNQFKIIKAIYPALTLKICSNSYNFDQNLMHKFKLITRSHYIFTPNMLYLCDAEMKLLNKNLALKGISDYLSQFSQKIIEEKDIMKTIEESPETEMIILEKEQEFKTENLFFASKDCEILAEFTEIYSEKPKFEQQAIHEFFIQKFHEKDPNSSVSNIKAPDFNTNSIANSLLKDQIFMKATSPAFLPKEKNTGPCIMNEAEMQHIGRSAEHYFFAFLSEMFPGGCQPKNWVSSKRLTVFGIGDNINDAAGYDFEILDVPQKFKPYHQKKPINLLFEVKGFKDQWSGNFIMSQNEINRANESINNPFESYYVVIVEFVGIGEIRFAAFFDWRENRKFMKFTSETAKIEWDQKLFDDTMNQQKMNIERPGFSRDYEEEKMSSYKGNNRNQGNYEQFPNKKECFHRYRCKHGFNCTFRHSEAEMNFFKIKKIDGQKFVDFGKVKVVRCRKTHQNENERDGCGSAHDEYDSFCLKCNGWSDHVRDECPY